MPTDPRVNAASKPEENIGGVWRYLDFTKYVSLLATESLFFCRADKFEDPYEGVPHSSIIEEQRRAVWNALSFDSGIALDVWQEMDLKAKYEAVRSRVLVNCWHENDHESAAMWRLYLQSAEGVAVRSTAGRLRAALVNSPQVQLARVRYVDFNRPLEAQEEAKPVVGEELQPFFLKRLSFAHEREVRAVLQVNDPPKGGTFCDVQLDVLIGAIYVAPYAPGWFSSLVRSVNQRYGIGDKPVIQSQLYEPQMIKVPETPY